MMDLEIQHIEVHVTSLREAKDFYVNKLGLQILDEIPAINLLAVKAGNVRISIFGGFKPKEASDHGKCGPHLIFRTNSLEKTIQDLTDRGVIFSSEIVEAGGFIRDIVTQDPDGNIIEIAECLRDPLI